MNLDTISSQLYFVTVKIETIDFSGNIGSGTGFIVEYDYNDNQSILFLVTNRHVVDNSQHGKIIFHLSEKSTPLLGKAFEADMKDWLSLWFFHPESNIDLAICPFFPIVEYIKHDFGVNIFFKSLSLSLVPTPEEIDELDAIETVTFVGYPNGIWDNINHLPVIRKGTTASPLQIDFENESKFLIDASVFGGSSGSPVLLLNDGMYKDRNGGVCIGSRFYLLGVVSAVYFRTKINMVEARSIPTIMAPVVEEQEMIDLGIVIKSNKIIETIEIFLRRVGYLK